MAAVGRMHAWCPNRKGQRNQRGLFQELEQIRKYDKRFDIETKQMSYSETADLITEILILVPSVLPTLCFCP
jgi:hypothetical protein